MRNLLKEFFYLQRDDRRAVITLLVVALVATSLVFWYGRDASSQDLSSPDSSYVSPRQGASSGSSSPSHPGGYYQVEQRTVELSPFDPNTADSTQLLRLGLSPWQVRSIYRYRAKGGVFHQLSDFARVYGLTRKQYRELLPYIRISPDYLPAAYGVSDTYHRASSIVDSSVYGTRHESLTIHKLRLGEHIALNAADTSEWKKIPGIGSGYARMIVSYRERLGGFVDARQLLEVEGVPESVLSYVTVDSTAVRKLNLNKLTLNQLRRHPYINYYQAREICDYRRLHGPLRSLSDLKFSSDFPSEEIERLTPYVSF